MSEVILAWISAIGTIGTLFIALRLLWDHHHDRKVLLLERKSALARKVSAWCDLRDGHAKLYIQNLGEEPVYSAAVDVGRMDADLNKPPDSKNRYMSVVFGTIPPSVKLDDTIEEREFIEGAHFPDLPVIAIEFTDTNGVSWRREPDGRIHEFAFPRPIC